MHLDIAAGMFARISALAVTRASIPVFRQCLRLSRSLACLCVLSASYPLAAQGGPNEGAEALLGEARELLNKDETDEAQARIQEALKVAPENSEAYFLMGLIHKKDKSHKEAIQEFNRAILLDESNIKAREQLAIYHEMQGRLDEAIEEYSRIVQWAVPGSDLARESMKKISYLTATRHAKDGRLDAALAMFEGLAEEYPEDSLILYSAGVAYMLKGRMAEARAMYERVLTIDPGHLNAYLNIATVDEAQGDIDQAVSNLKHIIEVDPESIPATKAHARLNIIEARILTQEGNIKDAIAAFKKTLDYDSSNSVALRSIPDLYRRLNDKEGERRAYEELVEKLPDDIVPRINLAQIYLEEKSYAKAYEQVDAVLESPDIEAYRGVAQQLRAMILSTEEGRRLDRARNAERIAVLEDEIRKDPGNVESMRNLAIMYFNQEMYQEAVDVLAKLVLLSPDDERVHLTLAVLHDKLGQFAASMHEYLWLISRTRNEADAKRYTAALKLINAKRLFIEGDLRLAGREFSEILAEDSGNTVAYFYLGLIYSKEEDVAGAADAYREVVRLAPTHVGARLNLANSYERMNREEDAIDEYRKILQANPPGEMADAVKIRLRALQKRIHGISAGLGYLFAYDSNSNLSDRDIEEELRSDLSLSLAYQYKTQGGYRWRLTAQPTYSNYHEGQYDYISTSETIAASTIRDALTLVGGYTYKTIDGLLIDRRLSRMHTLFGEVLSRARLPNILDPGGSPVSSGISFNLSYSDFDSTSSPFFSSYTTAAGVNVSQPVTSTDTLRLGYTYVINENKEFVGSDYAYTSHGLTAGLDHSRSWGGMNVNYGIALFNYTNPDSFSQFTERRNNIRNRISLGATYRFKPDINLFATLAWTDNRSNLPVGFILNSEDIIEGQQSSSLSDYTRTVVTTGINLKF